MPWFLLGSSLERGGGVGCRQVPGHWVSPGLGPRYRWAFPPDHAPRMAWWSTGYPAVWLAEPSSHRALLCTFSVAFFQGTMVPFPQGPWPCGVFQCDIVGCPPGTLQCHAQEPGGGHGWMSFGHATMPSPLLILGGGHSDGEPTPAAGAMRPCSNFILLFLLQWCEREHGG